MTQASDLVELIHQALLGPGAGAEPAVYATNAGAAVFRPGDWPTQNGQYPRLKLRVAQQSKRSIARSGAPQFTVTTTVQVIGEVSAPAQRDDGGATAAEAALWALAGQVELAIVNSYPLFAQIQQIASISSQFAYNSDAETHLAGISTSFELEWYQGPEDFAPIASDDLDTATVQLTDHSPTGFTADLQP